MTLSHITAVLVFLKDRKKNIIGIWSQMEVIKILCYVLIVQIIVIF